METWHQEGPFRQRLQADPAITAYIPPEELIALCDDGHHLDDVDEIQARSGNSGFFWASGSKTPPELYLYVSHVGTYASA